MKIIYITKKNKYVMNIICIISILLITGLITTILTEKESTATEEKIGIAQQNIENLYNNDEKIAYLTFDDGPTLNATPKILDILKEENIKATFFVVGKHVRENPEIVKREYEEGHYIANHGYSHNNKKLYKSKEDFLKEINDTEKEISKAIGNDNYCSHMFRFPNGFMSKKYKKQKIEMAKELQKIGYVYVDWNCLNKDSEVKCSNYKLVDNLKRSSKDKGNLVILMHDTTDVNKSYEVLKESIEYLKSQNYIFKLFDQVE